MVNLNELIDKFNSNNITKGEMFELGVANRSNIGKSNADIVTSKLYSEVKKDLYKSNFYEDIYCKDYDFRLKNFLLRQSNYLSDTEVIKYITNIGIDFLKSLANENLVFLDFEMNCNHSNQEKRINTQIIEVGIVDSNLNVLLENAVKPTNKLFLRTKALLDISNEEKYFQKSISQSELVDKLYELTKGKKIITFGEYDCEIFAKIEKCNLAKRDEVVSRFVNISPAIALRLQYLIHISFGNAICNYWRGKNAVSLFSITLARAIKVNNNHKSIDDARTLCKVFKELISLKSLVFDLPTYTMSNSKFSSHIRQYNYTFIGSRGRLINNKFASIDNIFDVIGDKVFLEKNLNEKISATKLERELYQKLCNSKVLNNKLAIQTFVDSIRIIDGKVVE